MSTNKSKPKKNIAVYHISSSRPKERFAIDAVYLSDYIANKDKYYANKTALYSILRFR